MGLEEKWLGLNESEDIPIIFIVVVLYVFYHLDYRHSSSVPLYTIYTT